MTVWIAEFNGVQEQRRRKLVNDMIFAKVNLLRLIMNKPITDLSRDEVEIQLLLEKDPEVRKVLEG